MVEFTFLRHDEEDKDTRISIINRKTAFHKHAQRRRSSQQQLHDARSLTKSEEKEQHNSRSLRPPNTSTGASIYHSRFQRRQHQSSLTSRTPSPLVGSDDFVLDNAKVRVFHYFIHQWMPSRRVHGSQLTGFTPVYDEDLRLADKLMREAFQSSSKFSLYATLTVCARRMRKVSAISTGVDLPEVYAARAISALRDIVEARAYFSSRLILDISYLVLSEVYIDSPQMPETYGAMIRDIIVMYGGLNEVDAFTAQACLGWDNLMSATTLSFPALDPQVYPNLLLKNNMTVDSEPVLTKSQILLQMQRLRPRPRVFAIESHSFTVVIRAIRSLPCEAQGRLQALMSTSSPRVFGLLTAPMIREIESPEVATIRTDIAAADCTYMHVKIRIYLLWLWHTAISLLTPPNIMIKPPEPLTDITKLMNNLRFVLSTLENSEWSLQEGVRLWCTAVIFLVSEDVSSRHKALGMLDSAVAQAGIESEENLRSKLAPYPPLHVLLDQQVDDSLWGSVLEYRLQYDWL